MAQQQLQRQIVLSGRIDSSFGPLARGIRWACKPDYRHGIRNQPGEPASFENREGCYEAVCWV